MRMGAHPDSMAAIVVAGFARIQRVCRSEFLRIQLHARRDCRICREGSGCGHGRVWSDRIARGPKKAARREVTAVVSGLCERASCQPVELGAGLLDHVTGRLEIDDLCYGSAVSHAIRRIGKGPAKLRRKVEHAPEAFRGRLPHCQQTSKPGDALIKRS